MSSNHLPDDRRTELAAYINELLRAPSLCLVAEGQRFDLEGRC